LVNRGGSITVVNRPDVPGEPFVVLNKPAGMPSGPAGICAANCAAFCDSSRPCDVPCALGWAMERYPAIRCITPAPGRRDYGLVHRLDTATSGLLLIALTQAAYDSLLAEQRAGRFVKEYRALVAPVAAVPAADEGYPPCPVHWERCTDGQTCTLESRFRPWGARGGAVRPVTEESGPAAQKKATARTYRTEIRLSVPKGGTPDATCRITEGFRHQVRCHLAWLGLPVAGDTLYTRRGGETPECNTSGVQRPRQGTVDTLPEVLPKKMKELNFFATGLFFHLLDKNYSFLL
jgi:23S rRNA pseudouridine1911/1915/1917 synthase